ncbi:MAG TPA: LacI family DNA-binding transcriptional regulator [Anaerolineales bacterium]|nr:LacI family DNA-binding transcriptional regulator [Anaerolineales bacterium]
MTNLTLEMIAETAGVSRSTVSRVVNDHPNVRPEVRERVQKVINETGYQPHAAARSLASRRTHMLGLVIPRSVQHFFSDPYFPRLTQGIAEACNAADYTLSLFLLHTADDEKKLIPRISRRGMLDGIIIQSTHLRDSVIPDISEGQVPFLVAGRPMNAPNASFIDVDNVSGAMKAVQHLIGLGRRRIATVAGSPDTAAGLDRLTGYRRALKENGLAIDEDLITAGDFTEPGGYEAAGRLLERQPDAIFCGSDMMAVGVLRRLKEAGVRVPEEISIVGYDDLPPARLTDPPLTTIRQPIRRFGVRAVQTLTEMVSHPNQGQVRVILDATELVVRGT